LLAILKQPNANLDTAVAFQILTLINRGTPAGLTLYVQQHLLTQYPLSQVTQSSIKIEQEALSKDAIYARRCLSSVYKRLENDKTSLETAKLLVDFLGTVVKNKKQVVSFETIETSVATLFSQNTNPAKA
jgi:hypothetical protein